MHDSLQKMGKNPKIIYSDDEKAIASAEFRKCVEGEGIELYRTRLEVIRHLQNLLSGLLKVSCSEELGMMKRARRQVYNGQTT